MALVWHSIQVTVCSRQAQALLSPDIKKVFFFFSWSFLFRWFFGPVDVRETCIGPCIGPSSRGKICCHYRQIIIYNYLQFSLRCLFMVCVCVCGGGVSSQLCSPCEYREMLDVLFTLIELCGLMGRLSNVLASVHWATGAQACCGRGHVWQPSHRQRRHARHRNLMAMSMRTSGERHTRL